MCHKNAMYFCDENIADVRNFMYEILGSEANYILGTAHYLCQRLVTK